MFDPTFRDRSLHALGEPFDLLVIGGGITGCGVLLDAAQRGLRVLLVEKGDLASGTSTWRSWRCVRRSYIHRPRSTCQPGVRSPS